MAKTKEIFKRTEKATKEKAKLTHISGQRELSTEEKFKISLCRHFVQFAIAKRMKLKDLSEITNIPISRLSEITNYKIKKFTVDQLLKNLTVLSVHDKGVKAYLSFLEVAIDLPLLKSTETTKLMKKIKDITNSKNNFYPNYV